jgi:hypothetical protein
MVRQKCWYLTPAAAGGDGGKGGGAVTASAGGGSDGAGGRGRPSSVDRCHLQEPRRQVPAGMDQND